ncbi:MAG: killer suppression protein [Pseudomonadota bacterium]
MDISFKNNKLARSCNSRDAAVKRWGAVNAARIMQRLKELQHSDTLADVFILPAARCHELKGSLKGRFAVDALHPFRLIFAPAHNPLPYKDDGGLDLEKITAVVILDVEDYHG